MTVTGAISDRHGTTGLLERALARVEAHGVAAPTGTRHVVLPDGHVNCEPGRSVEDAAA